MVCVLLSSHLIGRRRDQYIFPCKIFHDFPKKVLFWGGDIFTLNNLTDFNDLLCILIYLILIANAGSGSFLCHFQATLM